MKKAIVILTVFFVSVLFQSCDYSEYMDKDYNMTEADVLVASSEFVALTNETTEFSKEIRSNYLKLSIEQRREFLEINGEILKGKANDEELKLLWDKLSSIIKIDYDLKTSKINELAAVAYQNRKVSTRELLIAMEKRSINNQITRLKTRAESGDSYQNCLDGCQKKYLANLDACYEKYGRGDDSPERNRCVMYAGAYLNDCNAGCINKY